MIAHISMPAKNPKATALIVSKLIDGETFEFPMVPGAWIAIARDGSGVCVEVYPETMAHHPGKGSVDPSITPKGPGTMPWEDQIFPDGPQGRPSAFHVALTTKLDEGEVLSLAKSAGVRALGCERGGVFRLIEFWIDDAYLIEVLTPAEAKRYVEFMNPGRYSAMFGPGSTTA